MKRTVFLFFNSYRKLFLFGVVFVHVTRASATTIARALAFSTVRATDTFSTVFFRLDDINNRARNNHRNNRDCYNFRFIHSFIPFLVVFLGYSAFNSFCFFTIKYPTNATMESTTIQPTIGIHTAPKLLLVNNVPKKNTKKETVKPTAN